MAKHCGGKGHPGGWRQGHHTCTLGIFKYLLPLTQVFQGDSEQAHPCPCCSVAQSTLDPGAGKNCPAAVWVLLTAPGAQGLDGCKCAKSLCFHLRTWGRLSWHQHRLLGVKSVHSLLHTGNDPFSGKRKSLSQQIVPSLLPAKPPASPMATSSKRQPLPAQGTASTRVGVDLCSTGSWTPQKKTSRRKRQEKNSYQARATSLPRPKGARGRSLNGWGL